MQVKQLWCPTELALVGREHYEREECLDPPAPTEWLGAVLKHIEGDQEHAGNKFTATRLTACPRSIAIQDNLPVTVNLMDYNNLVWGSAMHDWLARQRSANYAEARLHGRLFVGTPQEVEISGRPDNLAAAVDAILDYKFHGADQQRFKYEAVQTGLVDEDWRVQFSVYKILAEANVVGANVERAAAWNGAMVGKRSSAPPWFKTPVPFFNEEQILKLHPLGGETSVAENILITKEFQRKLEAIDASTAGNDRLARVEAAVAEMPLSGESMGWRSKKGDKFTSKCEYCPVARDCAWLAGTVRV